MKRHAYTLTLLDDTIISRRAATLGGHQSLDYIPGQTLLGACAATLYARLGEHSYTVFHSGKLRFGNALPLAGEQPAYPIPNCWHEKKTDPALDNMQLQDSHIWNLSHRSGLPDAAQPKQLRDGYIDSTGRCCRPSMALRMKTAINPDNGRAAHGQLFGYQAIPRGSRFGGWIEADEELPDSLFEQVIAALQGNLLVGRSRSAEYGRAHFSDADFRPPPETTPRADQRQVTLWLLSDLAVQDHHGQPTLAPLPDYLGLPPGEVIWQKSFIRARSYSPWNGKRGAPDLERHVIQQGSVISYHFHQPPADTLGIICSNGLGLYREAGLGRVWLNPPLLDTDQPRFSTGSMAPKPAEPAPRPESPLIDWLEARQRDNVNSGSVEQQVDELYREFQRVLGWAAGLQGITVTDDFGPSAQQWGRVYDCARNTPSSRLLDSLFESGNAVVKAGAEGWKEQYRDANGQRHTLAGWLKQALKASATEQLAKITQKLAQRCREAQTRRGDTA